MCPQCRYSPEWQERGLTSPPSDYVGDFFKGPELTRPDGHKQETRTLYGCPKCNHVWMDW